MDYNTTREHMIIPEYGRNIQKMIEYTVGIEDREKRNKSAQFIVRVMGQMNPDIKESSDYIQTLWDHMHMIADFKLDVDSPYPKPVKENLERKPSRINYSDKKISLRHYGKTIENIIAKSKEFEEGEEKEALILSIANYLKRSYLTWNRESVSDATITKHLEEMSDGKLIFNQETPLISVSEVVTKVKPVNKTKKKPQKSFGTNQKKKYPR
jgi:hypothetical protein